jgi:excisionase family DNA binding protein
MMQETIPEAPLWSIRDAVAFLGVSQNTVYRLIKSGKLPTVKIGTVMRIRERDVLSLIETSGPVSSTSEDRSTPSPERREAQ